MFLRLIVGPEALGIQLPEYKNPLKAFAQLSVSKHLKSYDTGKADSLVPGLMGLLLTFACMWLKKSISIAIIIALFYVGVLTRCWLDVSKIN